MLKTFALLALLAAFPLQGNGSAGKTSAPAAAQEQIPGFVEKVDCEVIVTPTKMINIAGDNC